MSREDILNAVFEAGKTKTATLGEEELAQVKWERQTRADTRGQVQALFNNGGKGLQQDQKMIHELFIQTPGARLGAGLKGLEGEKEKTSAAQEPIAAPAVDHFFEKSASQAQLSPAQRRFPELQKTSMIMTGAGGVPTVGSMPSSNLKKRPAVDAPRGATPVQNSLSGGSA